MSKSACGKASSDSNQSDKGFTCEYCGDTLASKTTLKRHKRSQHPNQLDHSCPTCDKPFISRVGMMSHHKQVHGNTLRERAKCGVCGDTFELCPDENQQYCSPACFYKSIQKRVELTCVSCGDSFVVKESVAEERECCSRECRAKVQSERMSGENHHNYKPEIHVTRECAYCGDTFHITTNQLKDKNAGKYCSSACMDNWRSQYWVGENNPLFKGYDDYYGPNWNRQRRNALKRDQYRCRVCGLTERELSRRPSVHHIKPVRWFKNNYSAPEWYERGNKLSNLITLCPEHHNHVEGWFLSPDTRE